MRLNSTSTFIQFALLTTAFWHALAAVCEVPSRAHSESAAPRNTVASTGTVLYQEADTEYSVEGPNNVTTATFSYQSFTLKGTLNLTNLPQAPDANPHILTIETDSTFTLQFNTGYSFSIPLSKDPNLVHDISTLTIKIVGDPFTDDAYFNAANMPPKGWRTGDPAYTLTLKLTGPHDGKLNSLVFTLQGFFRFANYGAGSQVQQGALGLYGGTSLAAKSQSTAVSPTATLSFGDTIVGSVQAPVPCVGLLSETYKPASTKLLNKPQTVIKQKVKLAGKS